MRPVVLGRKNWIHVGSQEAAPKVAAILSVFETCRRLNIPVRGYLAAVLPRLAGTSIQRVGQFTAVWAAARRLFFPFDPLRQASVRYAAARVQPIHIGIRCGCARRSTCL